MENVTGARRDALERVLKEHNMASGSVAAMGLTVQRLTAELDQASAAQVRESSRERAAMHLVRYHAEDFGLVARTAHREGRPRHGEPGARVTAEISCGDCGKPTTADEAARVGRSFTVTGSVVVTTTLEICPSCIEFIKRQHRGFLGTRRGGVIEEEREQS